MGRRAVFTHLGRLTTRDTGNTSDLSKQRNIYSYKPRVPKFQPLATSPTHPPPTHPQRDHESSHPSPLCASKHHTHHHQIKQIDIHIHPSLKTCFSYLYLYSECRFLSLATRLLHLPRHFQGHSTRQFRAATPQHRISRTQHPRRADLRCRIPRDCRPVSRPARSSTRRAQ